MVADRTTADFGWDQEFIGYRIVPGVPVPASEIEALDRSIDLHRRACAPAPQDRITTALAELRVLTKARTEDSLDLKFLIRVYADRLGEWPADVVAHVLRTQANVSRWWPAWEELQVRLETYARKRRTRLKALEDVRRSIPA